MQQVTNRRLKGYAQHSVNFTDANDTQGYGSCPFCGKANKFYVSLDTGLFDCKYCSLAGNLDTFLEEISKGYQKRFKGRLVRSLANDRGLKPSTLKAWGIGWGAGFYSVPMSGNPSRRVTDIRRYNLGGNSLSTTGGKASFIVPLKLTDARRLWLCEGEWDALALYEILRAVGIDDEVYGVPGANNLPNRLVEMLYGREVIVAYDNDEAGYKGAVKVANKLEGASDVKFIRWPATLPNKFDVRDYYKANGFDASKTYKGLLDMVGNEAPAPLELRVSTLVDKGETELEGPGLDPSKVAEGFKRWLSIESIDVLDVMFGTVFANRLPGDPLWLLFVAPPGGMKTEVLLSLSKAPRVVTTTTLTPQSLISGANFGGGDPSLIPKLDGKVLVIKDLTTILEMNSIQRDEIFGILRDAYDGKIEKSFGNGITRRYLSHFGILAGVTPVIESVGKSNATLGERFLKYKLKDSLRERHSARAIRQAVLNIRANDKMRADLAAIGEAVVNREVDANAIPRLPEYILDRLVNLSRWVALLRGVVDREKYTGRVNFKPTIEVGTRLAKQLTKLAYGIAIYRGESVVSNDVYRIIVEVAQDTAPDRVEEIVKQMFIDERDEYKTTREIATRTRFPEETIRYLLQDLVLLGIVDKERGRAGNWKLTARVIELMSNLRLYGSKPEPKRRGG